MIYTICTGDPHWKRAKFDGTSADGIPYRKGERVFFYPRTSVTYAGGSVTRASAESHEVAGLEG